jgi:protease-4
VVLILFIGLGCLLIAGLVCYGVFGAFIPGTHLGAAEHGPRLHEVVKEEGNSHEKILILNVDGVISSDPIDGLGVNLAELIQLELDKAADDESIKGVILKVDSPGGEVLASDEIYRSLRQFQEDSQKPLVASMGNLAASGGYYISVPCQWIVANELSITGSIGVIMHGFNYRGLMDKLGLRPEVFKSGRFKDMMSPDKREEEITAEERGMIQKMVNETFGRFKSVVAEGRGAANKANAGNASKEDQGRTLASDWQDYADGRILSGREALEHGFVDELGNFDTAVERMRQIAGVEKPELIEYHPVFDFSQLFRMFGESRAPKIKVDVGISRPKLKSGYMYFIWPVAIP